MEHKQFWIFLVVILLVIVGLLLVFVLTGEDKAAFESTEEFTVITPESDLETAANAFEEAYNEALGLGLKIRELSFVSSFVSLDEFTPTNERVFKDNDQIIVHFLVDNVEALQSAKGITAHVTTEVHLYDQAGEEIEWFGKLYSFDIQKNVAELGVYAQPFFMFANAEEFTKKGTYTITIVARAPELNQSVEDQITFEVR